MPSWPALLLILVGMVGIPTPVSALSLELAAPELRTHPDIWFALESTLPSLPAGDAHFGAELVELDAPVTPSSPDGRDLLRTAYRTQELPEVRAAAARALRAVVPSE